MTKIYSRWGNPSQHEGLAETTELAKRYGAVQDENPHGLSAKQLAQFRMSIDGKMQGSVFSPTRDAQNRALFESVMPKGASLYGSSRTAQTAPGQASQYGSTFFSSQRPYMPELESADRQSFPIHRRQANTYWRMFYKMDPIINAVINIICDLAFGDFQLAGEGVDGEIKEMMEYACREARINALLPFMAREHFITGEPIPHLFFDDSKGIWTHATMHNPDQINVVYSPFIRMDPIMEFVPDPKLREIATSQNPQLARIRESMPPELISSLRAGTNIPLSPVNASFLPRKLQWYELRGTSIISSLWRVLMFEDSIFNASIQTARRAATPLKVLLMGDPATAYIPPPAEEKRMLEKLAACETDPQCFTPETPITMGDGSRRPIGELKLGDIVLDMRGQPSEVAAIQEESTTELVRVKCVGMDEFECTKTHKWPVMRKKRCQLYVDGKRRSVTETTFETKVAADKIQKGDFLLVPRTFKKVVPEGITSDHARLLGYYAAEGNMRLVAHKADGTDRWGFELALNIDEKETIAADVDAILTRLCGTVSNTFIGDRNNIQVRVNKDAASALAQWLAKHAGKGAKTKRLSVDVMQWPLELKREFLLGYLAGDGSSIAAKPKNPKVRYLEVSSASLTLIHQVQQLFAQLGILAKISHRVQSEDSFGAGNALHRLHIHGQAASDFSRQIWKMDVQDAQRKPNQQWWVDSNFLYVKITKVERIFRASKVINLSVHGDHSYMACGISTWNSWLIYNYQVKHELWGAPERLMSINTHYDLIERIKLTGLGVSKALIQGDASYQASAAGLTVFLQRLKALRQYFVNEWLIPKFFLPMAVINQWVKPSKKSGKGSDQSRSRRASKSIDENGLYIIPTIEWAKSLDPTVDNERLQALAVLENQLGIKVTDAKKFACVGLDNEVEQKQLIEESKFKRDLAGKDPYLQSALGLAANPGAGGGGGGGMLAPPPISPGIPPEAFGEGGTGDGGFSDLPPEGDISGPPGGADVPAPAPEGASIEADKGSAPKPMRPTKQKQMDASKHWPSSLIDPVANLLLSFDAEEVEDSDLWRFALKDEAVKVALDEGSPHELWWALEQFLVDENYPAEQITELQDILKRRGIIQGYEKISSKEFDTYSKKLLGNIGDSADSNFFIGVNTR